MIKEPCLCISQYVRTAIALSILVIAFILFVIGFASPYWAYENNGATTLFSGIWQFCIQEFSVTTCTNFVNVDTAAWFKGNQAVQTIGFILLFAALVLLIIKFTCYIENHTLKLVIIFLLGFAAAFILIGVVIYGQESPASITDNLSFGFILVVVAAGLTIIACILVCVKP